MSLYLCASICWANIVQSRVCICMYVACDGVYVGSGGVRVSSGGSGQPNRTMSRHSSTAREP